MPPAISTTIVGKTSIKIRRPSSLWRKILPAFNSCIINSGIVSTSNLLIFERISILLLQGGIDNLGFGGSNILVNKIVDLQRILQLILWRKTNKWTCLGYSSTLEESFSFERTTTYWYTGGNNIKMRCYYNFSW